MTILGIIFDLDGTLLNTLDDISDAMNYALSKCEFNPYSIDQYRYFVGSGVDILVKRALQKYDYTQEDFDNVKNAYLEQYQKVQDHKTRPYPGILELIDILYRQNIKLAILSNKPHQDTIDVVTKYFDINKFNIVLGQRKGIAIKPSPQSVYEILGHFNLDKDNVLYVGDTDIDMQTARNAGLTSVGVTWGFRTYEELLKNNANFIINNPLDLVQIINQK